MPVDDATLQSLVDILRAACGDVGQTLGPVLCLSLGVHLVRKMLAAARPDLREDVIAEVIAMIEAPLLEVPVTADRPLLQVRTAGSALAQ